MADALRYVKRRLAAIQKRRNFNPVWGAKQLGASTDARLLQDFYVFRELVGLARVCGLDVPYDPAGAAPTAHDVRLSTGSDVYVAEAKRGVYKIGHSRNPQQRRRGLQTANQDRINIRATIPGGGRALERALLRYTAHYRSGGHGGTEWRDGLTRRVIEEILRRLQTEGPGFLEGPPLMRKRAHGPDR